jgi:hypothetical protein
MPATPSTPCTVANAVECKVAGCELDPTNRQRGVCVATHANAPDSTPCVDTDNNPSTHAGCEGGRCVQTHMASREVCRTSDFWAEHAGTEKGRNQNITQQVINAAGGCIEICGEVITNTDVNSANSAEEALCVEAEGDLRLQLVQQLTAAALNCTMSNGRSDCQGMAVQAIFQRCNAACASGIGGTDASMCVELLDCFNSGGIVDPSGSCTMGLPGNCQQQPLSNPQMNLAFEGGGSAQVQGRQQERLPADSAR